MAALSRFREHTTGFNPELAQHEKELVDLYSRKREILVSSVCKRGLDRASAEDIVQEAFLKAKQALPRFKEDATVESWFATIVNNTARDWFRRKQVRRDVPLAQFYEYGDGDHHGDGHHGAKLPTGLHRAARQEGSADLEKVLKIVSTWDELDQRIWKMYRLEGKVDREIAAELKMSENTVKTRLRRMRMRLEKELGIEAEREAA